MKSKILITACALALPFFSQAQSAAQDWQHLDKLKDGTMGVSAYKVYDELLNGKKSETVIVAVIDGGVDPLHEDLQDVMWNNPGEIPNNGKDDDGNGYVDDVYGWNFIGGKDGKNVNEDQLEVTRLFAHYRKMFDGKKRESLSKKDKRNTTNTSRLVRPSKKSKKRLKRTWLFMETFSRQSTSLSKKLEKKMQP